jgi:hypothetical protein
LINELFHDLPGLLNKSWKLMLTGIDIHFLVHLYIYLFSLSAHLPNSWRSTFLARVGIFYAREAPPTPPWLLIKTNSEGKTWGGNLYRKLKSREAAKVFDCTKWRSLRRTGRLSTPLPAFNLGLTTLRGVHIKWF